MNTIRFFKVTSLPLVLEPDSFYYVNSGGPYAEAYLTDNTRAAKKIGNSEMIEALTLDINAGFFS